MRTYQPHAAWQKKTKLDTKGTKKKKEDQKYTNEIGICIPLLETIEDLKDKVITADALLTQHKIANYIRDRGGHYMLTLKDNQKTLNEEVTVFFQELFRLKPDAEPDFESRTGDETDSNKKAPKIQHGRSELRQIWVSEKLNEYLNDEFKFPGIAQVFRVRREVDHYKEGEVKKKTVEISVGITSLSAHQADAKTLLQYNRGHWSIEVIHRILDHDNNWNEDKCRIGCASEIFVNGKMGKEVNWHVITVCIIILTVYRHENPTHETSIDRYPDFQTQCNGGKDLSYWRFQTWKTLPAIQKVQQSKLPLPSDRLCRSRSLLVFIPKKQGTKNGHPRHTW